MEIMDTNQKKNNSKTKKIMIAIVVVIVLLFIASIGILVAIIQIQQSAFKFSIDRR